MPNSAYLAPVDDGLRHRLDERGPGGIGGRLDSHFPHLLSDRLKGLDGPADHAGTDERAVDTIGGRGRGPGDDRGSIAGYGGVALGVLVNREDQQDRVPAEPGGHLGKSRDAHVRDEVDVDAVGIRQFRPRPRLPAPIEGRRARHHHDAPCFRLQPASEVDGTASIEPADHPACVGRQVGVLRRFPGDEAEDHGRVRCEVGPVLEHELEGAHASGKYGNHRPVAVLGDHCLRQPLGMGGIGEPGRVEVLAVDFPVRDRPRQHRLDPRCRLDVPDDGAVLCIDDQETGRGIRRCGRRAGRAHPDQQPQQRRAAECVPRLAAPVGTWSNFRHDRPVLRMPPSTHLDPDFAAIGKPRSRKGGV